MHVWQAISAMFFHACFFPFNQIALPLDSKLLNAHRLHAATALLIGFVLFPTCALVRTLQVACQHRHERPRKQPWSIWKFHPDFIIRYHNHMPHIATCQIQIDSVWLRAWLAGWIPWIPGIFTSCYSYICYVRKMQCTDCTETVRTYWNTLTKFDNPLGGHFAATAHSRGGRISGMHSIHHDTSLFILVPFRLKILTQFPSPGNGFQLCMQKTSENVKALRLPSKATASFQIAFMFVSS